MNILLYSNEKNRPYILVPVCNNYVFIKNGFLSHYHIHPVYHLVFMLNGKGSLISDHTEYRLKEKDIFIVNPNEKHIYTSDFTGGMNHFTVNFYLIEARMDRLARDSFLWENNLQTAKIQALAETTKLDRLFSLKTQDIFLEYDRSKWADILFLIDAFCKSVDAIRNSPFHIISGRNRQDIKSFADLYSRFLTGFIDMLSGTGEDQGYPLTDRKDLLLGSIINQLNCSLYDSFSLSDLAEKLNYSPVYLCSYFRKKTGITLTQYLNKLKINKACEFLRRTDKGITEIAAIFGYSSSNHFSSSFKKEKGLSPKNYRKHSEL
jgi:AraC-like DNA-binding protein